MGIDREEGIGIGDSGWPERQSTGVKRCEFDAHGYTSLVQRQKDKALELCEEVENGGVTEGQDLGQDQARGLPVRIDQAKAFTLVPKRA